jgi:molecular chaperone GrpE
MSNKDKKNSEQENDKPENEKDKKGQGGDVVDAGAEGNAEEGEQVEVAVEKDAEVEVEVDPLGEARAEAADNYDRYLRAAAELDNFRKRTIRMRQESRDDTLRDVLLKIAPIMDNLRRALAQEDADADALKQGVELIANQLQEVFQGYGIEEVETIGEPFDPSVHEAMLQVESADHEPGTVMQEMEKGYRLRDKVLRPARVIVAKASSAAPADDSQTDK